MLTCFLRSVQAAPVVLALFGFAARETAADQPVSFARQIKPILAGKCFACHGPDEMQRQGELRLDVRDEAVPSVIKPGDGEHSEVYVRVTAADADSRMPPPAAKKPAVTAAEAALIRRWIDEGARYDVHWAYVPPAGPSVPPVSTADWPLNPIDNFILARLEAAGLAPAAEADRRVLLRRAALDLTGLAPSAEEIEHFLASISPSPPLPLSRSWNEEETGRGGEWERAYQAYVDRLLAAPRFGERMAVYWLDVVRYADTGGYHSDNHRDIWAYRDYVIGAFNGNKPFDEFTVEQLAGDLLPGATTEQRIASGYNRLLQTTEEGGAQPKEYAAKYAADRVRNTALIWLAATMGCAECHDHKYDPFSQRDFYRFAAFFADVKEKAVGRQEQDKLPTHEQAAQLRALDERLAALRSELGAKAPQVAALEKERAALEANVLSTLVTTSVPPRTMRVLPRGNWLDDSGEEVLPAVPASLASAEGDLRSVSDALPEHLRGRRSRLDLARWIVAPQNPLTARVIVNRLWKIVFGRGIVRSLDDFGSQGELPTHPELLDWLAADFVASGWDIKHTLRLMLTSRAYRQSSVPTREALAKDPANDLFSRQNRFRLEAEFIRDAALAASGLLVERLGGPSVKPYQPPGYWQYLNFPTREWINDRGDNQYRRGLYTYWQRTFLHPSLAAFDASSREECTVQRPQNNTPQQALVLLNDPTYVEAARVLAARAIAEGGDTAQQRAAFLVRRVLARSPVPAEVTALVSLVEKHRGEFAADPASAAALLMVGDQPASASLDKAELAAWTSAARVLLNLHEAITRE